ncbi:hypothetical protein H1R20_g9647, partial [Candolleomyces eurysporus]
MDNLVHEYSKKTGRTESNVVSHWGSGHGYARVHRSTWNKYQIQYKANRKQERARAGNPKANCNECFAAFKLHYGDNWKKILDVRDKILTEKRVNERGSRRSSEFTKFNKIVTRTAAKGHVVGFESVTLTVGNKLHHDQGLGHIVESEGAQGFLSKLPINGTTLIGLLQDFSFGSVSKSVQDQAGRQIQKTNPKLLNPDYVFSDVPQSEASTSTSVSVSASTPQPSGSNSVKPQSQPSVAGSGRARSPSVASISSSVVSKRDGKDDDDDRVNIEQIKAYFIQEYERLGCLNFPTAQLPWAKLKKYIVAGNLTITGWPEGVPFPVDCDSTIPTKAEDQKKANKKTGIRAIGSAQRRILATACANRTLRFERHQNSRELLLNSHVPWILGARPVDRTLGQRQCFYNQNCTRLRVRLRKPVPPTTPPSTASTSAPALPDVTSVLTPPNTASGAVEEPDASTPKASAPEVVPTVQATKLLQRSAPKYPPPTISSPTPTPAPDPASMESTSSKPSNLWDRPTFSHPSCNPVYSGAAKRGANKGKSSSKTRKTPVPAASFPAASVPAASVPVPSAPALTPSPPSLPPPASTLPPVPEDATSSSQPARATIPATSPKRLLEDGAEPAPKRSRGTTPAPTYTPYPMPIQPMMGPMPGMASMPPMAGMPHQLAGIHPMYGMSGPGQMAPMYPSSTSLDAASPPSVPEGQFQMPYGYYNAYGYYQPTMQPYPTFAAASTSSEAENPSKKP